MSHQLAAGDIVIATRDVTQNRVLLGSPAVIPDSVAAATAIAATNLYKVSNNSSCANAFLYWVMRSPTYRQHIIASAKGTTVLMLTKDAVQDYMFPLPPPGEQRAIAAILGALDDKIELNRKMSAPLEAMARALFTSWFVDFDPVRAKAEGRGIGLTPEIASLFPSSFVDSPVGPMPSGWTVASLSDLLELSYGKPLKAENRRPGPYPVYGSNGQVGVHDESFVDGPGIIVGRKGNPGTVEWCNESFWPIDTTFFVRTELDASYLYYFHYALQRLNLPHLSADSAVPGLNRVQAGMSALICPPERVVRSFAGLLTPLYQRAHLAMRETLTLTSIRDALLPKLISGELRVADAERALEKSA
jgi:type I restriction enzyme S subunit